MFNTQTAIKVEPGSTYREKTSGKLISTAHVISVLPDRLGIPHVHYLLDMRLPSGSCFREEKRVLALDRFASLFAKTE